MSRPMQGPALEKLRLELRNASPRGHRELNQIAVAKRLPFQRVTLIDIFQGFVGINAATSEAIQVAITAGIAPPSKNGKK